jgi:hypothetical protein
MRQIQHGGTGPREARIQCSRSGSWIVAITSSKANASGRVPGDVAQNAHDGAQGMPAPPQPSWPIGWS